MDCKKEPDHISVVDLSEEERDKFFETHGCEITRKLHEERKKNGYYCLCKRDLIKEERDKKDKEKEDQKNQLKKQEKEIENLKEIILNQNKILSDIINKLNEK